MNGIVQALINLHSTLVLLKAMTELIGKMGYSSFTFYSSSIKGQFLLSFASFNSIFTFYSSSIKGKV